VASARATWWAGTSVGNILEEWLVGAAANRVAASGGQVVSGRCQGAGVVSPAQKDAHGRRPEDAANGVHAARQPKGTRAQSGEAGTKRSVGPIARMIGWLVRAVSLSLCGLFERGLLCDGDGNHRCVWQMVDACSGRLAPKGTCAGATAGAGTGLAWRGPMRFTVGNDKIRRARGDAGATWWRIGGGAHEGVPGGPISGAGKWMMGRWVGPCGSSPIGKELNSDFWFY
jgi:hypothetical protein